MIRLSLVQNFLVLLILTDGQRYSIYVVYEEEYLSFHINGYQRSKSLDRATQAGAWSSPKDLPHLAMISVENGIVGNNTVSVPPISLDLHISIGSHNFHKAREDSLAHSINQLINQSKPCHPSTITTMITAQEAEDADADTTMAAVDEDVDTMVIMITIMITTTLLITLNKKQLLPLPPPVVVVVAAELKLLKPLLLRLINLKMKVACPLVPRLDLV